MQKSRQNKQILVLGIMTVVAVITWIAVEVYHTLQKPTPTKVPSRYLTPLNPNFDTETIKELKGRRKILESDIESGIRQHKVEFEAPKEDQTSTPSAQIIEPDNLTTPSPEAKRTP